MSNIERINHQKTDGTSSWSPRGLWCRWWSCWRTSTSTRSRHRGTPPPRSPPAPCSRWWGRGGRRPRRPRRERADWAGSGRRGPGFGSGGFPPSVSSPAPGWSWWRRGSRGWEGRGRRRQCWRWILPGRNPELRVKHSHWSTSSIPYTVLWLVATVQNI